MKNLLTYLCTIIFFTADALGQPPAAIDSLSAVIDRQSGLDKYEPLIALVREHAALSNYEMAFTLSEEAHRLALKHGDEFKSVQSGRIIGQLLGYLDRRKEALSLLTNLLPVAEKNGYRDEYKTILTNIANAHTFMAAYDTALKYHFKVLTISEDDHDSLNITLAENNIGLVYYKMGHYDQALHYFREASITRTKSRYNIECLFVNLGLCLNKLQRFKEAHEYFAQALQECGPNCNAEVILNAKFGLGLSCFESSDYSNAKQHLMQSLKLAITMDNKRLRAENMILLARINIKEDKLSGVSDSLEQVISIAQINGYTELIINAYKQLSIVAEKQNDLNTSLIYLKKHIELQENVYNQQMLDNLSQAKANFQERQNLATIKANEMTIAQQRYLAGAAIIIAVLIALLFSIVWRKNGLIKEAKELIFEQNKRLEIRNRELDVLVEDKTLQLRLANVSLKEMHDELNAFVSKASQEILAPLATLKGICHVARLDIIDTQALKYIRKLNDTITLLNSAFKRLQVMNKLTESKTRPVTIDLKRVVDEALSVQRLKGMPPNLTLRRNVAKGEGVKCDRELLAVMLENAIENAIWSCRNAYENKANFIDIDVSEVNGRVNVRIVNNGKARDHRTFHPLLLEEMATNELYFLKSTAKKIGGKVDLKKTPEGYNELSVVF